MSSEKNHAIVRGIFNVLWLHLKLLFSEKITYLVFGTVLAISVGIIYTMENAAEEKSGLIVGICLEDTSEYASALLNRFKASEAFSVITGTEEELYHKLENEEVLAVCVILDGYEQKVKSGKVDSLIKIYEREEGGVPLIKDLLAGEMMFDIMTATAYEEYLKTTGEMAQTSYEEYRESVKETLCTDVSNRAFDIEYVDGAMKEVTVKNSYLYLQVIFAVEAMLIGTICIYSVSPCIEINAGMKRRTCSMAGNKNAYVISHFIMCVLAGAVFSVCFMAIFAAKYGMDVESMLSLSGCSMSFIIKNTIIALCLAAITRKESVCQLSGMVWEAVSGMAGFVSIVLMNDGIPDIIKAVIPNIAFIEDSISVITRL